MDQVRRELLRDIPKVDECLAWPIDPEGGAPKALVRSVVREVLDEMRQAILAGRLEDNSQLARESLLPLFRKQLTRRLRPNLQRVVNATGVVIHTNLGRSLLPMESRELLTRAATHYSNLEFNLATGKRGSRYSLVEELLCELTGAEAALVVNNNAAAVLLALDTLASGREVVVSRGQLVEIGGSFRIPDVMAKSGARLVEVGATNRTHLRDYQGAITDETAMLLKVHHSNFRIIGFTHEVAVEDLVALAAERGLLVMEDLGSGSLIDLSAHGLEREPTVPEVVRAGVDVVTFSGDKLLGGPQAGIIVGRRAAIERIKRNPLNRALRIDKFTLAALESVLRFYYDPALALRRIPTLAMLTMPLEVIARRARRLLGRIRKPLDGKCQVRTVQIDSRVGGGAMPEQGLPSVALALEPLGRSVNELERALRTAELPVIGRIEGERLLLDLRTVLDEEVPELARCLIDCFEPAATA